jgi:hypothetical protein
MSNGDSKAGDEVTGQGIRLLKSMIGHTPAMCGHSAGVRVDHPNQFHFGIEVFCILRGNFRSEVVLAADLNDQFWNRFEITFRRSPNWERFIQDKRCIGSNQHVGVTLEDDPHFTASLTMPTIFTEHAKVLDDLGLAAAVTITREGQE